jgi:L-lactate dehydrogenase (cytochrome)/glycolate oxidase
MRSLSAWTNEQFDPRLSWADVAWIKERWGGKLILKGIMDVEDARWPCRRRRRHRRQQPRRPPARRRAQQHPRAAGHRGRGGLADRGLDGRRHPPGQDVLKAWALGARGTMIGRAWPTAWARWARPA